MIGQDNKKNYIKLGILLTILLCVFTITKNANAASLSVSVAEQTIYEGDTFSVDWFLDTEGKTINIVDAKLYYSPDVLLNTEIGTGSSALLLWVVKPNVITPGLITFIGGVPGGVNGHHIPLLRTVFKAIKASNAVISDINSTRVLLHDGLGTIVPLSMKPINFSILARNNKLYKITSPTEPNEDKWYRNNVATIIVGSKNGELYSYSFSSNPEITPTMPSAPITGPITYNNLSDGIYYFKLAVPINGALEDAGVYRVEIDKTSPEFLSTSIEKNDSIFNGQSFLNFFASDKTSGIVNYKVKVGLFGFYHEAVSPYQLSIPTFGNFVKIKATDFAGNTKIVTLYYRGYLGRVAQYCAIIILIIGVIGILIVIKRFKYFKSIYENKKRKKI